MRLSLFFVPLLSVLSLLSLLSSTSSAPLEANYALDKAWNTSQRPPAHYRHLVVPLLPMSLNKVTSVSHLLKHGTASSLLASRGTAHKITCTTNGNSPRLQDVNRLASKIFRSGFCGNGNARGNHCTRTAEIAHGRRTMAGVSVCGPVGRVQCKYLALLVIAVKEKCKAGTPFASGVYEAPGGMWVAVHN
ncbi:hypothetical protein EDC01DRAFT_732566 [Geopyxis carbonaria]|nr:hypothetical protein EDC01DRAFT_732566 [Geopyxis carbonaria]